jgi:tetratricopeptide (TPR) repeat protein
MRSARALLLWLVCTSVTVFAQCVPAPAAPPASNAQEQPAAAEAPKGKLAPEAKTQEELDAYTAAASAKDPTSGEAAADDFATKFPESELRAGLYSALMQRYQQADKTDKVLAMGRKVLTLDPGNPIAQVVIASTLAETASDPASLDEAMKDADDAVKGMDANLLTANMTPEQATQVKSALLATAHGAMGEVSTKRSDWAGAETHLKAAIAASPKQDPTTLMRLAIAQDHLSKFNDALDTINRAIAAADAQNNAIVAAAARKHKQRLVQLSTAAPAKKPKAKAK